MKHFTLKELSASTTATQKGIDNTPNEEYTNNLIQLVEHVLDPLRELYGKPIRVNSAYRCEALNKAVNGSKTSDHMLGRAADITAGSPAENKKLYDLIKDNLEYDQLIDEKNYTWIHVSYRTSGNRNQRLKL